MSDFMTAGGAGMYPTAVFGLFLVVVAALHAFRPRRELAADQRWVFALGIGESLHCMVLGLALAIVATFLTTAGSFRLARVPVAAPAR